MPTEGYIYTDNIICAIIAIADQNDFHWAIGMQYAKNSTSQTVPLGDRRALIPIKQPQNCCCLVTIQQIFVQILPE